MAGDSMGPAGMDGSAERSSIGGDAGGVGAVDRRSDDPPPGRALAATSGQADFFHRESQSDQAVEETGKREGRAFHGGASNVGAIEIGRREAEEGAGAFGEIGAAFAREEWQTQSPVGTGRGRGNEVFQFVDRDSESASRQLRRDRGVHGAAERQPVPGCITEGGDLTLGIADRLVRAGEDRSRCAYAHDDDTRVDGARAQCSHHVVTAAGTDESAFGESEFAAGVSAQAACSCSRGEDFRHASGEARSDGLHDFRHELARGDVEKTGARCISGLADRVAGEPQVDVVVRQEDEREALMVFGLFFA